MPVEHNSVGDVINLGKNHLDADKIIEEFYNGRVIIARDNDYTKAYRLLAADMYRGTCAESEEKTYYFAFGVISAGQFSIDLYSNLDRTAPDILIKQQ